MKTTYIKYFLLIFCVVSLASCIEDLGNYDYTPVDELVPITISGYSDTTVMLGDLLEIIPEVKIDDESRYVYTWYAYPLKAISGAPKRDTLSTDKALSVRVVMPISSYNLVFEIRDSQSGVFVSKQVTLTVTATKITTGWYVMKEVGDETDVDYINNDGVLIPNLLNEQIFRQDTIGGSVTVGNMRLKGKPLKMVYQGGYYWHQQINSDGSLAAFANKKAYHILTDRDIIAVNSDDMYLFKDYDQVFYMVPEVRGISNFFTIGGRNFLFNAANDVSVTGTPTTHTKVYMTNGITKGVCRFSYPTTATIGGFSNYNLHADAMQATKAATVFAYDKTSRRFVFMTPVPNSIIMPMNDKTTSSSLYSISQLAEYDMVWMLDRVSASPKSGYALLRSRSVTTEYVLAYISTTSGEAEYAFSSFIDVPTNARLLQAEVLASPKTAKCIYFAKGNLLSYHLDSSGLEISQRERDIYTFPPDETVAHISNVVATHLTVLTNNASGWKLYHFPLIGTTPDIESEPEVVYEGTGVARTLMKR